MTPIPATTIITKTTKPNISPVFVFVVFVGVTEITEAGVVVVLFNEARRANVVKWLVDTVIVLLTVSNTAPGRVTHCPVVVL